MLVVAGMTAGIRFANSDEPVPQPLDYREIATHLVGRAAASPQGVVHYRVFRFRLDAAALDILANILIHSQASPSADLIAQVEAWLGGHLPDPREAWAGSCAFRPDQWLDNKHRVFPLDTSDAPIFAAAIATGAKAYPKPTRLTIHSDGNVESTIENGYHLVRRSTPGLIHPLMPIDISFGPWQQAIDVGANIDGQQIVGAENGEVQTITYVNTRSDGSWVATEYAFCPSLNWAPASLRCYDPAGTSMQEFFGYVPTDPGDPIHVRAVLHMERTDHASIEATVWLIDSWSNSCDPSEVQLATPPVYMQLDLTSNTASDLTMGFASYLSDIEPCSRVAAALAMVIQKMAAGEYSREADFDGDGAVGAEDLIAVLKNFHMID